MRLDVFLYENGYVDSRTEAKKFISSGFVKINDIIITKPAYDVDSSASIEVDKSEKKYVSRGGIKLEAALDKFFISVDGKIALDVGASSGGFTDCLLTRGAITVISVDSGSGQLVESLRNDRRVVVYENFNARYMTPGDFYFIPQIVVMDVSFISATYIIPAVFECIADEGDFVCLIKPQFEVGRSGLGKGGIVRNDAIRKSAVDKVVSFAESVGFKTKGIIISPIEGGDGNIEYLAYFKKER